MAHETALALIETAPDAIVVSDEAGQIVFVNQQAENLLGYSSAELVGQAIERLVPARFQGEHVRYRAKYVANPTTRLMGTRRILVAQCKDGSELPIELNLSLTRTAEGVRVTSIIHDLTSHERTEAELRRQTAQLATLNRAMQALSASLDLRHVLETILHELRQVVPYDTAAVFQRKGDWLELVGGYGFPNLEDLLGITFNLTRDDNPNAEVVRRRAPFIVADAPVRYAGFRKEPHARTLIHGWLGVPMLFGDELIGMISLDKHEPNFYTEQHAQLALAFAAQAAIALANAQRFEYERAQGLRQAALFRLSSILAATLDETAIWQAVAEGLHDETLGYTHVALLEWDKNTGDRVMRGWIGWDKIADMRFAPGQGLSERPLLDGQLHYTPDSSLDPHHVGGHLIGCEADVPIRIGDQIIGVLVVELPRVHAFTQADLDVFSAAANQAGLALGRARLLKETQQRLTELATIHDISQVSIQQLELETWLSLVGEKINQTFDVQGVYIALYDRQAEQIRIPYWRYYNQQLGQQVLSMKSGLTYTVIQSRQPLLINSDYERRSAALGVRRVTTSLGKYPRSWLGVPIFVAGEPIGVLSIQNCERENVFTAADVRLLTTIAANVGIALQNAQLYTAVQQELSERKRAEEKLLATNEQLQAHLAEIEALQVKLREQAIRDPLTGLFNRRYLEETLARELVRATRGNLPLSIVMMDIDHFKKFNDTYGHKAGDEMLQALGELLRAQTRGSDVACRYGGEEFVAVLPSATLSAAQQRAEQWRSLFEALRVPHHGEELRSTLSLGVAMFPIHATTSESLLDAADKALYVAKSAGRNRVVVCA